MLSNSVLSRKFKQLMLISFTIAGLLLAGCTSAPKVRSDTAANTDFKSYRTFGFVPELATDKAGYTTLITQHFKLAIQAEMTALGYSYTNENPDLLVNFNSNVENRSETRTMPAATFNYGYYNYRRGYYTSIPVYRTEVDTVHYKVGTVNIDVVDAAKKQLIWEGLSEGVLKNKDLANPQGVISNTVNLIFQQFPGKQAVAN